MAESYVALNRKLFACIEGEECGQAVLDILLPNDCALDTEDALWDYKEALPTTHSDPHVSKQDKNVHAYLTGQLVRTIVSFYNAFGGYVVAGVDDKSRAITGFSSPINVDDLRKKIESATGQEIRFVYQRHKRTIAQNVTVGLLYVPRRPDHEDPLEFRRAGPASDSGKRAYNKGDIYFRKGHECRPQKGLEDMKFLLLPNRRRFVPLNTAPETIVVEHNEIVVDRTITHLVPRDEYIEALWKWLADRNNAIKLLAGQGGVGKTTIAAMFSRDLVRNAPAGFEKVIWLSAKAEYYRPLEGGRVQAPTPRFKDLSSLLLSILSELGFREEEFEDDLDVEELADQLFESLKVLPCFVVIDDVDSLPPDEQYEVFQTLARVFGRTLNQRGTASRVLLTARLDLGSARAQKIRVHGFEFESFVNYVANLCKQEGLAFNPTAQTKIMNRLHSVCDGSPLFAAAIVSLVANNHSKSIPDAVERWKDHDGHEVRGFAYAREFDQLTDSQLRTLYAIIELEQTSLPELLIVTENPRSLLGDDLTELRQHHLVAFAVGAPGPDEVYAAPESLRLMRNDVRAKIRNPTAVVRACRNARSDQQRYGVDASQVIYRVVAHWKNDEPNAALELAVWGDKKAMGRHPDIKCLLGRAYLNVVPQDLGAADAVLREAYSLGCGREELIPLWIDAKRKLKDWYGLIEITSLADRTAPSADNVVVRALAYREIGTNFAELGAYRDAAERFREGARDVQKAFHNNQARGRTRELSELGASLYIDYVSLLQRSTPPDAGLEVWEAACEAFDNYCRRSFLFRIGLREVMTWWDHVERGRDVPHPNTAIKMESILESIAAYRKTLINVQWSDTALLDEMASVLSSLTARLETYRAQLSPA